MERRCASANYNLFRAADYRSASLTFWRRVSRYDVWRLVDSSLALTIYRVIVSSQRHAVVFVLVSLIVTDCEGTLDFPHTAVGGEEYAVGIVEVGNLP